MVAPRNGRVVNNRDPFPGIAPRARVAIEPDAPPGRARGVGGGGPISPNAQRTGPVAAGLEAANLPIPSKPAAKRRSRSAGSRPWSTLSGMIWKNRKTEPPAGGSSTTGPSALSAVPSFRAGVDRVTQRSVMPRPGRFGFSSRAVASPSLSTIDLPAGSWPVTIRRTGLSMGCLLFVIRAGALCRAIADARQEDFRPRPCIRSQPRRPKG